MGNHQIIYYCIDSMLLSYAAGGYVVSSIILYVFPRLLHKTRHVSFPARFMAHRGGAGEWPENTLLAFKEAHKAGVEVFELDVQVSHN